MHENIKRIACICYDVQYMLPYWWFCKRKRSQQAPETDCYVHFRFILPTQMSLCQWTEWIYSLRIIIRHQRHFLSSSHLILNELLSSKLQEKIWHFVTFSQLQLRYRFAVSITHFLEHRFKVPSTAPNTDVNLKRESNKYSHLRQFKPFLWVHIGFHRQSVHVHFRKVVNHHVTVTTLSLQHLKLFHTPRRRFWKDDSSLKSFEPNVVINGRHYIANVGAFIRIIFIFIPSEFSSGAERKLVQFIMVAQTVFVIFLFTTTQTNKKPDLLNIPLVLFFLK